MKAISEQWRLEVRRLGGSGWRGVGVAADVFVERLWSLWKWRIGCWCSKGAGKAMVPRP